MDPILARKVEKTKEFIDEAKLSPDEKEVLHNSIDKAASTANGSQDKLGDLTESHCLSVLRATRFEASFKDRVIDALSGPLDTMKDELITVLSKVINDHVEDCPMRGKDLTPPETTWKDVAKAAVQNRWAWVAVAVATFSPNIVSIVAMFKK